MNERQFLMTIKNKFFTSDPYQWFFPLGILFGFLGTGLWILFGLNRLSFYPAAYHADLMIAGFFLTIAVGFLMTAIPRFTGTPSATLIEKSIMALVVVLLFLGIFLQTCFWFHGALVFEILWLLRFGLKRVARGAFDPPPSFPLVGFGLLMGLIGSLILLIGDRTPLALSARLLGRLFFIYGIFFGAVLGIGSQLLPAIMGIIPTQISPVMPTPLNAGKRQQKKRKLFILYGFILFASFLVEAFLNTVLGRTLRALLVTGILIGHWKIYRLPQSPGILAKNLWISSWMFLIGTWPGVFSLSYSLHGAHILFIGSLSLLIFSVATRVTLSHGGHDRTPEINSKALWATLILLLSALIIRLLAPFTQAYFVHLALASLIWMMGALSWSATFLPKLVWRQK